MTSGHEWDLTVSADDDELLAELRRRGVRPGRNIHVVVSDGTEPPASAEQPEFFGSFSGPADLAERSGEILEAEFPLTQ